MEKPDAYLKYEKAQKQKRPKFLYHYTSPDAAKSIIESKSFWATDCRYLNDPTEVLRNLQIAQEVADGFLDSLDINWTEVEQWDTERFLNENDYQFAAVLSKLIPYNSWTYLIDEHEVYITSFSENGDSLSQWRAYCNQGGYSLGFEGIQLSALRAELFPCIYLTEPEIRNVFEFYLRSKVTKALEGFMSNGYEGQSREESVSMLHNNLTDRINPLYAGDIHNMSTIMKDATFSEEREWRLIGKNGTMGKVESFLSPLIESYRISNNLLTPYTVFQFDELPLKEVVVGPTRFGHLAERSIKRLLNGGDSITIRRTSTPYIS